MVRLGLLAECGYQTWPGALVFEWAKRQGMFLSDASAFFLGLPGSTGKDGAIWQFYFRSC